MDVALFATLEDAPPLITATNVLVLALRVLSLVDPGGRPGALLDATTLKVLVLTEPMGVDIGEGNDSKMDPNPLLALLAVMVSVVDSWGAAPKTLVKLPLALVWFALSPQKAAKEYGGTPPTALTRTFTPTLPSGYVTSLA